MMRLAPLLASFAAMDVATLTHRLKRNAVFYGLAMLFLLTAYILAVAALAVRLGQIWGLPIALIVIAGGSLVLAGVLMLWVSAISRAEARRKRETAASQSSKALMLTAGLSALPLIIKSRPLLLAATAAGIGFLAMRGSGRPDGPAE